MPPLGLRSRALLDASIAGDLALRTGLASVLGAAMLKGAASRGGREDRKRLRFYADLADAGDAAAVFSRPRPRVRVHARSGPDIELEGCRVQRLSFRSPYRAINPWARADYARAANNAVAVAEHWRHVTGPRRTLAVIHGFGASPVWLNAAFFALRDFFLEGWDVLLYTLPFHGSRRSARLAPGGIEMFSGGMARTHEAIIHAVHDFRVLLDYLERLRTPSVGVTGISLGGSVTALLAAVDDRLAFAIPNAPVVWIPSLIDSWTPANALLALAQCALGLSDDLLWRACALHSPLSYPPVLPRERLMIVCGMGDRLAPPAQGELLWEHWGRPALHWFAGSHVLHFGRDAYLARMRAVMSA